MVLLYYQSSLKEVEDGMEIPCVQTVRRTVIKKPKFYTRIESLVQQKEEADPEQRTEINREIEKLSHLGLNIGLSQKKGFALGGFVKTYRDLNGNLIGGIYYSLNGVEDDSNVNLGDSRFVRFANFDFVCDESRVYPYIRTSFYLRKEGVDALRKYFKRDIKSREWGRHARKSKYIIHPCSPLSNRAVRDMMERYPTKDVEINGYDIHMSLRGKIEIFSFCEGLETLLVDGENLSYAQRSYLNRQQFFSPLKKWVLETNPVLNLYIASTFQALAEATKEILK